MPHTIQQVEEFHTAFGVPVVQEPTIPNKERAALRVRLIQEELDELASAFATNNIVEILDALTDLQYVLDGTYLECGMQLVKYDAFNEVHTSNMSKLWPDGTAHHREDGKVLKGPNFFKPDLEQFVHVI